MKEKNKRKKQQAASGKNYTGLVLTCIMTAIAVIYVGFAIYFESHFCFGTSIDGIAVGGSSVEKVEDAFRTEMKNYQLTVTAREDKNGTIAGSDIDMEPVFQGEIETLLNEQNGFSWLIRMFQKQEFELEKVVSYDEQKLNEAVSNLPCMKDQRTPVDATYADYTKENGYALVPADYGTEVDAAKVKKAVSDAILVLDETVDLEQSDCYRKPAVGDDDKDLLDLIDTLNQYVGVTITYDFGDDKEVLDGTTISTWLSEGTDEKVSIDEEEVLAFVKTLAKKYNTAYSPKELKTSYGTTVTVTGGFYGWRIDNSGEVEQILADLKAGKDVEREPVYLTTANSHGEHDYGDSYVEINLTNQHLFLYKDGKLVVESDFVSGNLAKGHDTPTGAFGLTYKTMNAVLRGPDYETPVTYWMPFNGDVGMHDATWRNKFGGSIYKTGGSHGCINLPASAAKKIYETIDKGYAVLVYRMPGDNPTVVQQPQADVPSVINAISIIGPVTLESAILAAIRNNSLKPESICIEMTESGFMDMTPSFCRFRKTLDDNNINFVIDDFGTGYSNFHCIRDMNPSYVKMDKDFTAKAMHDARDNELYRNIIPLVHSIDVRICAEGIEERDWYLKMKEMQVDYLQGYYFGRPCRKEQFIQQYTAV